MSEFPFEDLPGRHPGVMAELWARRVFVTLLALVSVAALLGAFGQQTSDSTAAGPAARLKLAAPSKVRGGLMFQSRVEVQAQRTIGKPRLVLADGWLEGMQMNSVEPDPSQQASRDSAVVLEWNPVQAGKRLVVWLQFQVNPTAAGHRSYDVELDDGPVPLARINRDITVLP
jgi:hypothetical protein